MPRRVVIVGGGVFAVPLVELLVGLSPRLDLEIALVSRSPERLAVVSHEARRRGATVRPDVRIEATTDLALALQDAAVVILLVRVGGLEARARDEAFPREFGLVGDEGLGPGGMANALRTFPVLRAMAQSMHRVAPKAFVLNLVAPLGITTRLLLEAGLHAVGLCELPLVTRERWLAQAKSPPERRAALRTDLGYAGFNHLGWFWPRDAATQAFLEEVVACGAADRSTGEAFGALPLAYYDEVVAPGIGRRLGRERKVGRAAELIALREEALTAMRNEPAAVVPLLRRRSTPWFDAVVAPVVATALTGRDAHDGFVNVRNGRNLPWLPPDVVVELPGVIAGTEITPRPPADVPPAVQRFLAGIARVEEATFRAARDGDELELRAALAAWPTPLSVADCDRLAQRIRKEATAMESPS